MEGLPKEFSIPADEKILMEFRREYKAFILPYIITISILFAFILILFIIINILVFVPYGVDYATIFWLAITVFPSYTLLFVFLLIVGILIVPIIGYFYVRSFRYLVTNKRFVVYWKFIFCVIRETKLEKVTDIVLQQSFWGRVFNYGDINPITPGMQVQTPNQTQSSGGGIIGLFMRGGGGGGGGGMGGEATMFATSFASIDSPFELLYKFKSIDVFGRLLDENR